MVGVDRPASAGGGVTKEVASVYVELVIARPRTDVERATIRSGVAIEDAAFDLGQVAISVDPDRPTIRSAVAFKNAVVDTDCAAGICEF